jgi:DNA repair exonuclease SbcCD ATPase subunit
VHFLDQVANSREIQSWLIDATVAEDLRSVLLGQCGRIDAFMRQNGLEIDIGVCQNFAELPLFCEETGPVFGVLCLANDVIRKYANYLLDENDHLGADVQRLRHEVGQLRGEMADRVEEVTSSLSLALDQERAKAANSEQILVSARRLLKKSAGASECLQLLEGNVADPDGTQIEMLEDALRLMLRERDAAVSEKEALRRELRQHRQALRESAKGTQQMREKIIDVTKKLESQTAASEARQDRLNELAEQNSELQEIIRKREETIKQVADESQETIAQNLRELEKKEVESAQLRAELEEVPRQIDELKRGFARDLKARVQKLTAEIEREKERQQELQRHYEPIVANLRGQLGQVRQAAAESQAALAESEGCVKRLKSELASATIDGQMTAMKLSTLEEKTKREQTLAETRFRMKLLSLETTNQAALEEQQLTFNRESHAFLVSICEKFKDFVDFSAPISEDSVHFLLDQVLNSHDKIGAELRDAEESLNELAGIRMVLGVDRDVPVTQSVVALQKAAQEYERARSEIESDRREASDLLNQAKAASDGDKSGRDWEQWAKRLHGLVTDNFTTAKTGQELQFALEETLLGGLAHRQTNRRLEILRMEKQLLTKGLVNQFGPSKRPPSFGSVLCVLTTVRRLQKLAGHLPCSLATPRREGEGFQGGHVAFPILNVA